MKLSRTGIGALILFTAVALESDNLFQMMLQDMEIYSIITLKGVVL
jgi:hypothetical protein